MKKVLSLVLLAIMVVSVLGCVNAQHYDYTWNINKNDVLTDNYGDSKSVQLNSVNLPGYEYKAAKKMLDTLLDDGLVKLTHQHGQISQDEYVVTEKIQNKMWDVKLKGYKDKDTYWVHSNSRNPLVRIDAKWDKVATFTMFANGTKFFNHDVCCW